MDARKAEEEYRRLEHLSGRLYRQEEEMRRKEQEARERRLGIREHDQSFHPSHPRLSRGFTPLRIFMYLTSTSVLACFISVVL